MRLVLQPMYSAILILGIFAAASAISSLSGKGCVGASETLLGSSYAVLCCAVLWLVRVAR